MFIKEIYIKEYEQFKETTINVESVKKNYLSKQILGNINISALIEEYGEQRTDLMRFIALIFHNLQSYHKKVPDNFQLIYTIEDSEGETREVTLQKDNEGIYIKVEGIIGRSLMLEFDKETKTYSIKRRLKNYENTVTYEEVENYLPEKVIFSVFSAHGKYPLNRPYTYKGNPTYINYDISRIYRGNKLKLETIQNGIQKFLELYIEKKEVLDELLRTLSLSFTGKFSINNLDDKDYFISTATRREFNINSENGKEFIENYWNRKKNLHFYDLFFKRNGRDLSLHNMDIGEKVFFIRIFSILSSVVDNSIVLIEELELHLSPSWTNQIMNWIKILFEHYKIHLIITTHNHLIINNLFPENILFFNKGNVQKPNFNTFLANEREITLRLFKNSRKANSAEKRAFELIKHYNKGDSLNQDIIEYLGESYIKVLALARLNKIDRVGKDKNVESDKQKE
ncbi:AAA family ATPase [Priestia aryabhattai]|uniref:AAA family ATPase n=1 Tax=Priestia aryabhattai TaxID=412384 RepID=UPI003670AAD7